MIWLSRILCSLAALCLGSAAQATTTIRILNAYQNASVGTTLGSSDAAIIANMAQQISSLNAALSASGANFTVTLVGSVKATTLGGSSVLQVLTNAYDDWSILAARDAVQADVTMVFVYFGSDPYDGLTGPAAADTGMSAVNVRGLPRYAYLHEFGHLLGAQHQDAGGMSGNMPGGPSWAHGYYNLNHLTYPTAHDACGTTIMAYPPMANWLGYNCGGSYNGSPNTYQMFSFSRNVAPYGDATHNNVYQLNLAAPSVANWHLVKLFKGPAILATILNFLLLTE
jgi:hypothetical protein